MHRWSQGARHPKAEGRNAPAGRCRLFCSPWSITQRLMLLLVSFGDFLGTTLMSRLRALSRPCAEAPSRANSSSRCLISSFRSLEESSRRASAQQSAPWAQASPLPWCGWQETLP